MAHINLSDVVAANNLLMTMGGDDQLPKIASAAIERSLELQHRIDRALRYAEETPPNSMHARQMGRILDGSITFDDEMNEVDGNDYPMPRLASRPVDTEHHGSGLTGRSTAERKAFREWLSSHGMELPLNQAVPQHLVDDFDKAMGRSETQLRRGPRGPYAKKGPRGKLKPGKGLSGRNAQQRLEIRAWIDEQGFDIAPSGRIPQKYLDAYDEAQEQLRKMRAEQFAARKLAQEKQEQQGQQGQGQSQEQQAQGA